MALLLSKVRSSVKLMNYFDKSNLKKYFLPVVTLRLNRCVGKISDDSMCCSMSALYLKNNRKIGGEGNVALPQG